MKLYILKPKEGLKNNPWDPWYDKAFGFVVRATDEKEARDIASNNEGEEGKEPWLDETLSSCEELLPDGDSGVIIQDFARA